MKIFIRTTGERKLDSSIEKELGTDYVLLIDKEHKPLESFIYQLKHISEWDSLLLEDDVILCENFLEEITKAIKSFPNKIINFFTAPFDYFTTHVCIEHFVYNQCTYYPKGMSKIIAEEMEKIKRPYIQYDTLENQALKRLNMVHVKFRPCLVQHIDNNTLIQNSNKIKRRTIWFIDYLKELNIPYEEAYTEENQIKLYVFMKNKFED